MDGLDATNSTTIDASAAEGAAGAVGRTRAAAKAVFVIGTTSRIGDIDAAVRRAGRIDQEIEIGVPSSSDREVILMQLLRRSGVCIAPSTSSNDAHTMSSSSSPNSYDLTESTVREVAKLAHGMVGSDLLSVVKEAFYLTLKNAGSLTKALNNELVRNTAVMVEQSTPTLTSNRGIEVGEIEVGVALLDPEDEVIGSLANEFADLDVEEEDKEETEAQEKLDTAAVSALAVASEVPNKVVVDSAITAAESAIAATAPVVTAAALRQAVSRVSPSALREVVIEVPCVRWTDIGGMEPVKQSLREVMNLTFFVLLRNCFVPVNRGSDLSNFRTYHFPHPSQSGGGVAPAAPRALRLPGHRTPQGSAAVWTAGLLQDPDGQGPRHRKFHEFPRR